jgi:DNA-binding GntR family transcriptional regulator
MSTEPPTNSTARIVAALTTAIVERRLMPGTRLVEQQLADRFAVSRTLVRQALNQLSRDHLVRLLPGRGAFVAEPSPEEARQVFEVRHLLELQVVNKLCASASPQQIMQLRKHLALEARAVRNNDAAARARLLAEFHTLLGQLGGNQVLAHLLTDLLARCALIALTYQSNLPAKQSTQEHAQLVDAIEVGDAKLATRLMAEHLGHVEQALQTQPAARDLATALSRVGCVSTL